MSNEVIKVVQLPVIAYEALKTIGAEVSQRIEALNLEGQVANEDTIKALKDLRAELNKELKEYEDQRKAVKSAVNDPYSKFEAEYKAEISEKYDQGIKTLKEKIDTFELQVKKNKEAEIKAYFEELVKVEGLDWLTYDRLNVQVNLSTSVTAFKKQVQEVVSKVVDDVKLINTETFAAEIMTEYKRLLNASQAITMVRERKEAIRLEEERKKYDMIEKRKAYLRNLPMVSHDLTKSMNYLHDEGIYLLWSDLELSENEWRVKLVEVEAKIAQYKSMQQADEPAPVVSRPTPLSAPVVEQVEPQMTAEFRVVDTPSRLRKLAEYMKQNGYQYENI